MPCFLLKSWHWFGFAYFYRYESAMNPLAAFTILLLFQLAGTLLQRLLHLRVPGAVLGMVMLFTFLIIRKKAEPSLQNTALGLLRHLPLLFIPAAVGIIRHFSLLERQWLPITGALIGSSIVTLAFTAWLMQTLLRLPKASSNESQDGSA